MFHLNPLIYSVKKKPLPFSLKIHFKKITIESIDYCDNIKKAF